MTVGELKAALEGMDDGRQVVLAKDAEGSNYGRLQSVMPGRYLARSPWTGEFWDYSEASSPGSSDAVCLWPVG